MLRIQEFLSSDVLSQTLRSTSAHAMLVVLKDRYAPSDKSRKAELLQRYRHLQKPPSSKDVEVWLDEWLTVYHDAHTLELPDMAGERATIDFLQAIESLHFKFYTYGPEKVEDTGVYPLLQEGVTKLRARIRQTTEMETVKAAHGTFPVIFRCQGVEQVKKADQTENKGKDKAKKQCVYGGMHLYCDCFYLNESRHPAHWIPRPDTLMANEEKLAKDEK